MITFPFLCNFSFSWSYSGCVYICFFNFLYVYPSQKTQAPHQCSKPVLKVFRRMRCFISFSFLWKSVLKPPDFPVQTGCSPSCLSGAPFSIIPPGVPIADGEPYVPTVSVFFLCYFILLVQNPYWSNFLKEKYTRCTF